MKTASVLRGLSVGCAAALLVVVAPALAPAGALATGRYVATTGADSGDCTSSASPCLTINYAVSQAVAGDIIHVAAGTYPEVVTVDKSLVFEGANAGVSAGVAPGARSAESVVKGFRSPATNPPFPFPVADQEYSTTIDGFTIDPLGDSTLIATVNYHLVSLFGGPDVRVQNNIFNGGPYDPNCGFTCTTMTEAALLVQSGTFNVSGNLFTNFRAPINITQNDAAKPIVSGTIAANTFTHVTNRAIWLLSFGGVYPGVTVSGNNFDATGWVNPDWGPAGVVITTGGNNVTANTFTDFNSGVFVQVCDGSNPGPVANAFTGNHFLANGTGIQFYVVGTPPATCAPVNAAITNNDFVGNTGWGVRWNGEPTFVVPNTLNATCNWWGAPGGANRPGADKATAGFITSPWNSASGGPCNGGTVPTSKGDCMQGGWQHLVDLQTSPFKSQGDCVSFVATGGKNTAQG